MKLYDRTTKDYTEKSYRVVKAKFKVPKDTTRPNNKGKAPRVENEVLFVTNNMDLPAKEVAEAYRRRWDIVAFFRFIKQELKFSHYLSVSENGIKIVLCMTLITAMMIMIYKRRNNVGYYDAKFAFKTEMADYATALGIFFSGSDVAKFTRRYTIRDGIPTTPK